MADPWTNQHLTSSRLTKWNCRYECTVGPHSYMLCYSKLPDACPQPGYSGNTHAGVSLQQSRAPGKPYYCAFKPCGSEFGPSRKRWCSSAGRLVPFLTALNRQVRKRPNEGISPLVLSSTSLALDMLALVQTLSGLADSSKKAIAALLSHSSLIFSRFP